MVAAAAVVAEGASSGDGAGIGSCLTAGGGGDMGDWGIGAGGGGAGRNGSNAKVVGWWL